MDIKLDHFKLYEVDPIPIPAPAPIRPTLRGQFDPAAQTVVLGTLRHFANPVSKNEERILDPNAHLTVYDIQSQVPDPLRSVKLDNQFGEQKLVIDHALLLLVPALKGEPGISFPKGLDHFKGYRVVEGDPIDKTVSLKDQFDEEKVQVGKPIFFCVPVLKRHNNQVHEIKNPDAHLTIYSIDPKGYQVSRDVKDQFWSGKLTIRRSIALAVPSLKKEWGTVGV